MYTGTIGENHARGSDFGKHVTENFTGNDESKTRQDPDAQFNSLAHLMDEDMLTRAYRRIRKGAAVGVDGVSSLKKKRVAIVA